jgi:hypothetical protein
MVETHRTHIWLHMKVSKKRSNDTTHGTVKFWVQLNSTTSDLHVVFIFPGSWDGRDFGTVGELLLPR